LGDGGRRLAGPHTASIDVLHTQQQKWWAPLLKSSGCVGDTCHSVHLFFNCWQQNGTTMRTVPGPAGSRGK
jgi:hypothetical protein